MLFTCPRCSRTKDFSGIYVPPLGRSYRCPCGLSTIVRPTWASSGAKSLTSAAKEPETQKPVAIPAEKVKERLASPPPKPPAPPPAPIVAAPKPTPRPAPIGAIAAPVRQIVPSAEEFSADGPTARQPAVGPVPMPALAPLLEPKEGSAQLSSLVPEATVDEENTGPMPMPRRPAPSFSSQHATGAAALVAEEPYAFTEVTAPGSRAEAPPMPELTEPGVPIVVEEKKAPEVEEPKPTLKRRLRAITMRASLAILAVTLGFGGFEYWAMVKALPPIDVIKNYRPPIVTEVRTNGGTLVGKFYKEERYVTALEDIPVHVRQAFLASEDAGFYEHSGVDGKSIARALIKNLMQGRSAQGGSTITQQVARTFALTREKTYRRKIAEIMLARKLEQELSKDEILHRYLNQIFFGHGAYGVEAASRIHFGKHVTELTIAEAALIAGLPQAPSRYAPRNNPDAAIARRHYVLGEMLKHDWITKAQYDASDKEPLALASIPDPTKTLTPFVTEQIRRELFEDYGSEVVLTQGLQVVATVDTAMQFAAQSSIKNGLTMLDRRIGYRPLEEKSDPAALEEAVKALGEKAPTPGQIAIGIVEEAGQERAYLRLAGRARGVVHKLDNPWAYPVVPEAYFKTRKVDDLSRVFKKGDHVRVRILMDEESTAISAFRKQKKPDEKVKKKLAGTLPLALVQDPELEASLLSFAIPDGRVLAMVGGSDYKKSEYLRPMQAKRQVGSTFKTLVYAAALAKKPPPGTPKEKQARFTLATILQDAPVVMKAHEAELGSAKWKRKIDNEDWKPGNSGDKYYGDTPLRTAYILSRNVPTLQLAQKVGIREIISFSRKMGIESDLPPDLSLALGSASLTLFEITRAHAAFPAGGYAVDPKFIERVLDRNGNVVYDLESEIASRDPIKLIDPKTAFVMTQLMLDVSRYGTAHEAGKQIKKVNGGKTGTTNDYVDAWYVGFTPTVMTGVWVGYDQVRSLGVGETGAEAALPIWIEYMKAASEKYPDGKFVPPEGVVKLKVDRATGKRARPGQKPEEVVETWFVRGTEPTEIAQAGKIRDEPNLFEIDPGLR